MPPKMDASGIESKLRESLAKDRAKPSRCMERDDGVTVVNISGMSSGLLLALSLETGESDESILARMDIESDTVSPVALEWGVLADGEVLPHSEERSRLIVGRHPEVFTLVRRQVGPWDPVVSDAEQAKTAEYRTIIEQVMEGK
jgi:hypothetical protein